MAENQLENGFTRISNQTLEAMASARLSGREWCLIMTIWRNTYGWNRTEAKISLSDMEKATGISRRHCINVVASLQDKGMIAVKKADGSTVYSFQKDYDKWVRQEQGVPEIGNSRNRELPNPGTPEIGNTSVPESGNTSVPETGNSNDPVTPDLFGGSESLKTVKERKDITSLKKSANPKAEKKKAASKNGWAVWVDVCRTFRKPDPLKMGPDLKASASALAALGGDTAGLAICYENFLYDEDPYLVKSGHPLRDMLKRLNLYKSQGKAYFAPTGERISEAAWIEQEARDKKFLEEGMRELEADRAIIAKANAAKRQERENTAKEDKEPSATTKRLLAHIVSTLGAK